MMSQKKQLSNVSKELGCTLIKLTRRTILLTEKNFQDCSNLLRLSKYPSLSCTAEEFFLAAEDEIQIFSGFFDPAD